MNNNIDNIIIGLIREHKYLNENRIHYLIYLGDIISSQSNIDNFNFGYYKSTKGVYCFSKKLEKSLERLKENDEIKILPDYQSGNFGTRYATHENSVYDLDLDENIIELIKLLKEITKTSTSKDLEIWSKKTKMYNDSNYDEKFSVKYSNHDEFKKDVFHEFSEEKINSFLKKYKS